MPLRSARAVETSEFSSFAAEILAIKKPQKIGYPYYFVSMVRHKAFNGMLLRVVRYTTP